MIQASIDRRSLRSLAILVQLSEMLTAEMR